MSTILKAKSHRAAGFQTAESISMAMVDEMQRMATDHQLEVADASAKCWKKAILQGFQVMKLLETNKGGYVIAGVKERDLRFTKWYQPRLGVAK